MPERKSFSNIFDRLRKQVEYLLNANDSSKHQQTDSMVKLIDELENYQTHLEIQNKELKETKEEIAVLNKEFEHLYEFAPCGYASLDSNGIITRINATGMELLGKERKRIVSKPFRRWLDNPSSDTYLHALSTAKDTGETQTLEAKFKQNSVTAEWVRIDIEPESDDSGTIIGFSLVFFDISARKQMEDNLRQQKTELEHLYERMNFTLACGNLGTWDRDLLTGDVVWNEQLYRLLRRSPGNFVTGDTFFEYIHPGDVQRVKEHVESSFAQSDVFEDEFRIIREDGEVRWLYAFGKVIRGDNNKPIRLSGINFDITDKKQGELEREQLLAERMAVMENMNDALLLADLSGNIIYHNPASLTLHGYESQEEALLPKDEIMKNWEIFDADDIPVPFDDWPIPRVLAGETFNQYKVCVRCREKNIEFIGSYNGTLIRNKAGEPLFAMLTIRDITESKRSEQKIEWLSRFPKENPNPIFRIAEGGEILYANEAASCILKAWDTVVGGTVNREIMDIICETVASGKNSITEYECDDRVFLFYCAVVSREDYVNIYATDITRLKEIEEKLEESRNHFASILHSSIDMIITVDKKRHILDFNEAAEKTFGYKKKEVVGKHIHMLYADKKISKITASTIYKNGFFRGEVMNIRKDRSVFPAFLSASLLRDRNGNLLGKVGVSRDITDRKNAEIALRKSRADLALAQEIGHIGNWRLNNENKVFWSDENYRIFGIPKGMPIYIETFLDYVHPDDKEFVDRQWKAALKGEEYNIEHRIVVGGEVKWVHERAILDVSEDGSIKEGFGITQDITETKKLQDKIKRSAKVLTDTLEYFPGVVSVWDNSRRLVFVNKKWKDIFGKRKKKIIGKTLKGAYSSENRKEIDSIFRLVYQTGTEQEMITNHSTSVGEIIYWRRFIPIYEDQDTIEMVIDIGQEITTFERTRESLETIKGELESLVESRTKELKKANEELWETNIALKRLVNEYSDREDDAENNILRNLDVLVRPYLLQLENQVDHAESRRLVEVILENLEKINVEFGKKIRTLTDKLSPTEMKVANLIRKNYETNEIAEILNIEIQTVFTHRRQIRKKLGMKNKNVNLKTYLMSITDI